MTIDSGPEWTPLLRAEARPIAVQIDAAFVGTLVVQRTTDGTTWRTMERFIGNTLTYPFVARIENEVNRSLWRAGFAAAGDYTSGAPTVELAQ